MKILYSDSDPDGRNIMSKLLSQTCDKVIVSSSGEYTKEQCFAHRPDILIMEINFNDGEICHLIEYIESFHPAIKIILIGKDIDFYADVIQADAYVNKPVDFHALYQIIKKLENVDFSEKRYLVQGSKIQELSL